MKWEVWSGWLLWAALMTAILLSLGWGARPQILGLFLASGLAAGSLYALGGIGIVLLYRTTGVLNLSCGAAGAAGAMTTWQLLEWGWYPPATWIIGVLLSLGVTLFYGIVIAPLLAWRDTVVKAVATLGYALIILGLVAFIWIDEPRKLSLPTDSMAIKLMGMRFTVTRLIVIGASVGAVTAIWAYLRYTNMGLQMRALANDRDHSALLGIPIRRVETVAWTISGAFAGFTGIMFADLIRLEVVVITFMVIPSIAAAICGRLENLAVVLVAGISMGVIENLLTLSPTLKGVRPIAPFVIAVIVLFWLQRGKRLTFAERA